MEKKKLGIVVIGNYSHLWSGLSTGVRAK